jgi:rhamnosyltransferase
MTAGSPLVSILLLTRNGMRDLPAVWDAIAAQDAGFAFETVVVDSGSTDGSARFLRERADRFLAVAPADFNHGATRNLGVAACRGAFVVLLVQDAIPTDRRWLAELVAPLREDARVAGTFARQLARPDASAITRHYHERWLAAGTESRRVAVDDAGAFARLSPMERMSACIFDNVCSCIRKEVWRTHPFSRTSIGEDIAWGRAVLLAGHALVFAPQAVVIHSHERGPRYELKRTALIHAELYRLFGLRTIRTPAQLGHAVASCLRAHVGCVLGEAGAGPLPLQALARGIGLAVAWPLGQYLGGRSAERGWPPLGFARGV